MEGETSDCVCSEKSARVVLCHLSPFTSSEKEADMHAHLFHRRFVCVLAIYYLERVNAGACLDQGRELTKTSASVLATSLAAAHVWMRQQRAQRACAARHLDPWQRWAAHQARGKRRCGRSPLLTTPIVPLAEEARLAGKGSAEQGAEGKATSRAISLTGRTSKWLHGPVFSLKI